ncbi:MAG: SsrA-binding protein SmpB [Clostridiales bacterium]|jgi:SsrA-binding protein|nr:SsrA-binding protein SmpB [Clostridiales bacterium]
MRNTAKIKLIAQNKKAYHDYYIEEIIQAGIELVGTEVKSLRENKCNLRDSFIKARDGEAFLYNMHISPYEKGNIFNKDPLRIRRLLMHRREIRNFADAVAQEGYTIVPTRIYFDKSLVKIDVALAKGKKLYDKRDAISKKDQLREAERSFKEKIRL